MSPDVYTSGGSIFQGKPVGKKEMICSRCRGNFAGDDDNLFNDGETNVVLCDNCKRDLNA